MRLFLEQVGVGAGACEQHLGAGCLVDQQPVGCDVALCVALPRAFERMVAPLRIERAAIGERIENGGEQRQILAAFRDAFVIAFEGAREAERLHTRRAAGFFARGSSFVVGSLR